MHAAVVVMTDAAGWHGRQLQRAFAGFDLQTRFVSLSDCWFELDEKRPWVAIPGFADAPPAAVFVRSIEAGTFEQVTHRLSLLHALRELGTPVYNDARAIERSVDKAMTTFLLRRDGIPTLPTWSTERAHLARGVLMRETSRGHDVVSKPLFGSQGKGLRRLGAGADVPPADEIAGVWYLQRFRDTGSGVGKWHDWRVLVAGGMPVAAMLRRGQTWITNVAQGARVEVADPAGRLGDLAVAAARAVGADYAGVDLMRDESGEFVVVEVNSIPAWQGLQRVASINIAGALAADIATRVLRIGGRSVLRC
ncbi:MAG TPA: RimK family alpha-L-glutamate ligase [Burkholderiaceae bacterium]|nr:RimK family alpha-L-glutamate ligase [Burkholderiaceae bacterium]